MKKSHEEHAGRLKEKLVKVAQTYNINFDKNIINKKIKFSKILIEKTIFSETLPPLPEVPVSLRPELSIFQNNIIKIHSASKKITVKNPWKISELYLVFQISLKPGIFMPFTSHASLASWKQEWDNCYKHNALLLEEFEYYPILGLLFPTPGKCRKTSLHDSKKILRSFLFSRPLPYHNNGRFSLLSLLSGSTLETTSDNELLLVISSNLAHICIKNRVNNPPRIIKRIAGTGELWSGTVLLPGIDLREYSSKYLRIFEDAFILIDSYFQKSLNKFGGCSPAIVNAINIIPLYKNDRPKTLYIVISIPLISLIEGNLSIITLFSIVLMLLSGCLSSQNYLRSGKLYNKLIDIKSELAQSARSPFRSSNLRDLADSLLNSATFDISLCMQKTVPQTLRHLKLFPSLRQEGIDPSNQITSQIIKFLVKYYANLACKNGEKGKDGCVPPIYLTIYNKILEINKEKTLRERIRLMSLTNFLIEAGITLAKRNSLLTKNLKNKN